MKIAPVLYLIILLSHIFLLAVVFSTGLGEAEEQNEKREVYATILVLVQVFITNCPFEMQPLLGKIK